MIAIQIITIDISLNLFMKIIGEITNKNTMIAISVFE